MEGDGKHTFSIDQDKLDRMRGIEMEYRTRIKYNFAKLLFLGVIPGKEAYLLEIIDEASRFPGYEKHKTIKYRSDGCEKTCHLYVKYSRSRDARQARDGFREWPDLNAELVSDILLSWFTYERMNSPYGGVTKGTLDFVGRESFNEVLDEDIAKSLLLKFGDPQIRIDKGVVNIAFSSMAEGIAACIVFGKWKVKRDDKDQAFYYRVQLEGTDSFSALIQKTTHSEQVAEAYKLEYFALPDVPQTSFIYESPQRTFFYRKPESIFNYENASRGRNYLRTGREFVRSRPNYNHRGGKYRQNRQKYQSGNVYETSNTGHFSQDGTYYEPAEFGYFDRS